MDSLANKPIPMILFLIKFSGRIQIHEYAYHYFHLKTRNEEYDIINHHFPSCEFKGGASWDTYV